MTASPYTSPFMDIFSPQGPAKTIFDSTPFKVETGPDSFVWVDPRDLFLSPSETEELDHNLVKDAQVAGEANAIRTALAMLGSHIDHYIAEWVARRKPGLVKPELVVDYINSEGLKIQLEVKKNTIKAILLHRSSVIQEWIAELEAAE